MDISEIATKADIEKLKVEILEELRKCRLTGAKISSSKEWLKSYEVCNLLSISKGTLASYRRNGTLRHSKIGGLMYYKLQDLEALMLIRRNG